MRRLVVILAVLTASLVSAVAPANDARQQRQSLLGLVGDGPGDRPGDTRLVHLDPVSLTPRGRHVQLGWWNGSWRRSPDGQLAAFAREDGLALLDVARMYEIATLPQVKNGLRFSWPHRRRLFAATAKSLFRIDPLTRSVVEYPGTRVGALVGPVGFSQARWHPLRLTSLERGLRSIVLSRFWIGPEPWRPQLGTAPPAGGAAAMAAAQADLARRLHVPGDSIRTASVTTIWSFLDEPLLRVVLIVAGRHFDYRVDLDANGAHQVWLSDSTDIPPALRADGPISGPRVRYIPYAGLQVDAARQRAYVVVPGRELVEVDLRTLRTRLRRLSRPLGEVGLTYWLDGGVIALGESYGQDRARIALIDTRTWRVRHLPPNDIDAAVTRRLILSRVYRNGAVDGVAAYDARGRKRFHVLRGRNVWSVQASETHAYLRLPAPLDAPWRYAVVDLARGRVVATVTPSASFLLPD